MQSLPDATIVAVVVSPTTELQDPFVIVPAAACALGIIGSIKTNICRVNAKTINK
jgi:hypothetical protein